MASFLIFFSLHSLRATFSLCSLASFSAHLFLLGSAGATVSLPLLLPLNLTLQVGQAVTRRRQESHMRWSHRTQSQITPGLGMDRHTVHRTSSSDL